MQIIDAQIHLWTKGTVVPPHRTTPYLLDEALRDMDAAGVHGAILHPPSWDAEFQCAGDRGRAPASGPLRHPRPHSARPAGQARADRDLEAAARHARAALHVSQPHMKSWPTDGTMDWLWPAAERLGLPVALLAGDFLPLVGEDCRTASGAAAHRRSFRHRARQ